MVLLSIVAITDSPIDASHYFAKWAHQADISGRFADRPKLPGKDPNRVLFSICFEEQLKLDSQ